VAWRDVSAPESVAVGEELIVTATVRNDGETPWTSTGPVPVNLGYHWLDQDGEVVRFEGQRTVLPKEVAPGARAEVTMTVVPPEEPGRYTLELDLVREKVAWFSRRGAKTRRLEIEVTPAVAALESLEPEAETE
jgi:hypothetical protein